VEAIPDETAVRGLFGRRFTHLMAAATGVGTRRGFARYAGRLVLVSATYFGTAKLGLTQAYAQSSITAVWPPTGIALAALIIWGYRLWPGVALGAFLANSWTGVPLVTVLGITTGNTLEALVGAYLLRRVAGFQPSLERVRDVLALVVLAGGISTMVSATVGVASLRIGGEIDGSDIWSGWRVWWLGDMGGDLLVAPLLLVLASTRGVSRQPGRILEGGALLGVLVAVSIVTLSAQAPLVYLIFPVLIWAALRFGQMGAAAAGVIVAGIAVGFTANGSGPFVRDSLDDSLLLSQTFVGVASITALLLAAVARQLGRTMQALQSARGSLEVRVRERTAELERSNAALELQSAIAANMAEGVVLVRMSDARIVYVNRTFEQMFGYGRGELEGAPVGVVNAASEKSAEEMAAEIVSALKEHGVWSGEVQNVKKDGASFWCQVNMSTFEHPLHGQTWVSVHTDIDERKRAEERLEQSDLLKTTLLRAVSHDFRSPLTAITAAGEASALPSMNLQRRQELSAIIVREADRLSRLVAKLLDLSRLQAGAAAPRRLSCSIEEVIDAALEQMSGDTEIFEVSADPELPSIYADPSQLERAFANLFENARRFVGDHPVEIRIQADEERMVVRVADRGPGIAESDRERIFEPFYRGAGSESGHRGSGLGLAIVKGFVEANGGRVFVEPLPREQGATFVIELPLDSGEPVTALSQ
jgi:PAS domain S-box-containing protein